jgi:RNA polymerase sigma factor (sigma-70 family)
MVVKPRFSKRDAIRDAMTDDELMSRTRAGEKDAFDELYRRHAGAARRTARAILGSRQEADDVVADAFVGVLRAVDGGLGPRDNFRSYLLACVRNGCKMTWRANRPLPKDPSAFDDGSLAFEDPERYVESGIVAAAFASLSPCWQQTLWLTAVEGECTDEVARQLRRSPSAVPALALRAREAFAEAYLSQHMARVTLEQCKWVAPKLAGYVRGHIGESDRMRVAAHLDECPDCRTAIAGLRDVNSCLRSLTLPAGLGVFAASGLGASSAGGIATAGVTSVAGSGFSTAGVGALFVKIAALAALASPVVVYEVAHPTLAASAEQSASASSEEADAVVDAGATVDVASGNTGEPDGGSSTGAPPSAPGEPAPPLLDAPALGDGLLLPPPGSVVDPAVTTRPDGTTIVMVPVSAPFGVPVDAAAVAVDSPSSTMIAAGVDVGGAQAAVGAGLGPEDVAVGVGVGQPSELGVLGLGLGATVGPDGITVGSPGNPLGAAPPVQVPVALRVAPVAAPVFRPVVGILGDLLGGVHQP